MPLNISLFCSLSLAVAGHSTRSRGLPPKTLSLNPSSSTIISRTIYKLEPVYDSVTLRISVPCSVKWGYESQEFNISKPSALDIGKLCIKIWISSFSWKTKRSGNTGLELRIGYTITLDMRSPVYLFPTIRIV